MINASVVLYKSKFQEIEVLVNTLRKSSIVKNIYLIDNSPTTESRYKQLNATYIFNNKNLGYGSAHNIAIKKTIADGVTYHLVVNPDIVFDHDILSEIVNFMDSNTNVGLLMPQILYPSGEIQYLCKLIPTPFDLIFRRYLPKKWTQKRTKLFELHASGYNKIMNVPYLSGCFMFLRREALIEVGTFDERFFLYPEDIDLSRRIHEKFRTVFFPTVSVTHFHAKASYKSKRLMFVHIFNMIKYFNKWGWVIDKKRDKANNNILNELELKK